MKKAGRKGDQYGEDTKMWVNFVTLQMKDEVARNREAPLRGKE
jgi:hypothetical protein